MFPRAQCDGCGQYEACSQRGAALPTYPTCRAPLRGIDVARAAALLAHLGGDERADDVRALERVLIERLRRDTQRYSDVFEPSFSCDTSGSHLYRFSYAFPAFAKDTRGAVSTILAMCQPFGPVIVEAYRSALRAVTSPAVSQPLWGFAEDGEGQRRVKLYLQFHPEKSAAALALACKMLGLRLDGAVAGELHLLGLDFGAHGLMGAKLYFVQEELALRDVPARFGAIPVVEALALLGVERLRNVLSIHRVAGPGALSQASEVDFALAENELRWRDVRALAPVRALRSQHREIDVLEERFRLVVRRLSTSVGSADKLTAYYCLAEQAETELLS